jgi:C-terminal processing protease CtpA/Prc
MKCCKSLSALSIACLAALITLTLHAGHAAQPLTPAQYEEALKAFIEQVDTTYPFFHLKDIREDWNACKKDLLDKVGNCRSNDEFYGLLAEAGRCLRDAHLGFSNLKGKFPPPEPRSFPGISFLPAANKQVVIMSSVKEYAGDLPPGTVVSKIDGKDARQLLDEQAEAKWNAGGWFSSRQRARMLTYRIPLEGKEGDKHQLTIQRDGRVRVVQVVGKWAVGGWPHVYAMPKNLARKGSCLYTTLESGCGYIYLRHLDRDLVESVDAALNSFKDIKGLIIDLRGNGGGGCDVEIFKRFNKKEGKQEGVPFYGGPVVVIIDAGTFSAGETFARDLFYTADARLIGSPTAGSSTAKRTWELPHGLGTVIFSTRSHGGLNRKPIEYYGIVPRDLVEVVPAELQKGINSAIARAEELLLKRAGEQHAQ